MVFLYPVEFFGLIAISLIPMFLGMYYKSWVFGMIGGLMLLTLFSVTNGMIVEARVITIEGAHNSTNTSSDLAYEEIEQEFSGEVRLLLIMVALCVTLVPVLRMVF